MNYRVEWMPFVLGLGVITLLFVPYLGLLVALALVVLVAVALVAAVGTIIASPFLLIRAIRRRAEKRAETGEFAIGIEIAG
jgi:hypothetical protein